MADASYQPGVYREQGGGRMVVKSGASLDVESGGEIDVESGGAIKIAGTAITATAAELNKMDGLAATGYPVLTALYTFTESAATTYTATHEIAAGTLIHNIGFTNTVLWGATTATVSIGDDDAATGWCNAANIKATDLLVGEVFCAADDGTWGGKEGANLTSAGRRGLVDAGNSGWYYGVAAEIIFVVSAGTPSTTGRSFGWVTYSVPTATASTDT